MLYLIRARGKQGGGGSRWLGPWILNRTLSWQALRVALKMDVGEFDWVSFKDDINAVSNIHALDFGRSSPKS